MILYSQSGTKFFSYTYDFIILYKGSSNPPFITGGISGQLDYSHSANNESFFFSNLFVIPDFTSSCPIYTYLQSNSDINMEWATLTSTCLGIRIGRLELASNFRHVMTFSGLSKPEGTSGDYSILVNSFLSTTMLQLGNFIVMHRSYVNSPAATLRYKDNESSISGILYNSNVTIFDSVINTNIFVNGPHLTFNGFTTIFDHFDVFIFGSFDSQLQWVSTPIIINGQIANGYIRELNVYLLSYIQDLATEIISARQNAKLTFDGAKEQLESLRTQRENALQNVESLTNSVQELQAKVNSLNNTLSETALAYNNALSQYNEPQATCNITTCGYVCVSGTNCTTCYNETTLVEKGSCPVYVTETDTSIMYIPYSTIGWRYEI